MVFFFSLKVLLSMKCRDLLAAVSFIYFIIATSPSLFQLVLTLPRLRSSEFQFARLLLKISRSITAV